MHRADEIRLKLLAELEELIGPIDLEETMFVDDDADDDADADADDADADADDRDTVDRA